MSCLSFEQFISEASVAPKKRYSDVQELRKKNCKEEQRRSKKLLPELSNQEKVQFLVDETIIALETDKLLQEIRQSIIDSYTKESDKVAQSTQRIENYEKRFASCKSGWSRFWFLRKHRKPTLHVPEYDETTIVLFHYNFDFDEESAPSMVDDLRYIGVTNGLSPSQVCSIFAGTKFKIVLQKGMFKDWVLESFYSKVNNVSGYVETAQLLLYKK